MTHDLSTDPPAMRLRSKRKGQQSPQQIRSSTLYARPNGPLVSWWHVATYLVDDDAPPHVPVDRAPVRHHVNPVTGRVRFDCADC